MTGFTAIIPARSGSKGIKDKNLSLLHGYPLLSYSIAAAKKCPSISRVIVSTDSELYADVSKKFGAEVPFLRPKKISADNSSDYDFIAHAIEWFEKYDDGSPEFIVHLRPTTPLREPSILEAAISIIKKRNDATSLRSAHIAPESPFKWFRVSEKGYFVGLNDDDTNLDKYNEPRQNFPEVFIPNGYIDIIRCAFVRKHKLLHGDKVLSFETPFCYEVDTKEELDMIEFQMKKDKTTMTDYLKGCN